MRYGGNVFIFVQKTGIMKDRNTHISDEIVLEPINARKVEVMIRNGQGKAVGGLTGVTVHSGGQYLRVKFPMELRHDLLKWFEDYRAHINDGFLTWSQDEWNVWYVKGWSVAEQIKALLPDDVRMYYGTVGMSKGVIRCVDGHWQINESLHHVEIVSDKTIKMGEGTYIPSVCGDFQEDHPRFEYSSSHSVYKIQIPKSEHHLSPQDAVVLHNLNGYDYQDDVFGLILEVHDDGIIVEVYGYMGYEEFYSVELIG